MVDMFSIIGRRMSCQSEFHRLMVVVLVIQTEVTDLTFAGLYIEAGIKRVNGIGDAIICGRCCEFNTKRGNLWGLGVFSRTFCDVS
jgi:hypothetical protein